MKRYRFIPTLLLLLCCLLCSCAEEETHYAKPPCLKAQDSIYFEGNVDRIELTGPPEGYSEAGVVESFVPEDEVPQNNGEANREAMVGYRIFVKPGDPSSIYVQKKEDGWYYRFHAE